MEIKEIEITKLKEYENNPRINDKAVEMVAKSIQEFGFKNPIIIDKDNVIVCGHTRKLAAQSLGLKKVPCIIADDLTPDQINAFRLVDNRTNEIAEWDLEALTVELANIDMELAEFKFDDIFKSTVDISDETNIPDLDEAKDKQEKEVECPFCGEKFLL